jgi:hypothetical protein
MKLNRNRGDVDAGAFSALVSAPGIDPRTWVSYGLVEQATQDEDTGETQQPVEFDPDFGPLILVRLQPSDLPVRCRVSMSVAGDGEGSYHPFMPGDEVLVLLPEGTESGSPCITGRLTNSIDKFPSNVAGQDPTGNKFGFTRRRTPYIQEFSSTWMIRVASHGGFALLSEAGSWTFKDGSGGALQMGPDIFGYSEGSRALVDPNADPQPPPPAVKALLQLDLTGRRLTLQMDDALFVLNSSDADANVGQAFLGVPAQLTVALGTNQPFEHVATTEFVLAMIEALALALAAPAGGPAALIALATTIATGGVPLGPTLKVAYATGLPISATVPKPPADPVTGLQVAPTLGATFFITG